MLIINILVMAAFVFIIGLEKAMYTLLIVYINRKGG